MKTLDYRYLAVVLITVCCTSLTIAAEPNGGPPDHMQALFFLDKFCIARSQDMQQRFFQPEPVKDYAFVDDHPNAGGMEMLTVRYDREARLYKMWYFMHLKHGTGGFPKPTAFCYAESRDGLQWDLPQLSVDTDRMTRFYPNAVFSGKERVTMGAVRYDPYDADASRRYKLAYEDGTTMHLAWSADGIKWRIADGPVWHASESDTENDIWHNPYTGKYQIICRASDVDRRVAVVESVDLKTWTVPRILLHPEPLDPLGLEFYGMPVFQYEGLYLGCLWKFQTGTSGHHPFRTDGTIEPELTYSYDGVTWNRTHRTFIERSIRGTVGGGRIYLESIVPDHEDRLRFYSRGYRIEHGSKQPGGAPALILHTMRKDGFVGMESLGYDGYLQTKPFKLMGNNVSFNILAPQGVVQVQLSDKEGKPYPGFTFEDCENWSGDETAYVPQWKGKSNLAELQGKPVRFELKMTEGVVYAIRAKLRPFHGTRDQAGY
jgi:hypothetical protein